MNAMTEKATPDVIALELGDDLDRLATESTWQLMTRLLPVLERARDEHGYVSCTLSIWGPRDAMSHNFRLSNGSGVMEDATQGEEALIEVVAIHAAKLHDKEGRLRNELNAIEAHAQKIRTELAGLKGGAQ